jgi:hypothetical protein
VGVGLGVAVGVGEGVGVGVGLGVAVAVGVGVGVGLGVGVGVGFGVAVGLGLGVTVGVGVGLGVGLTVGVGVGVGLAAVTIVFALDELFAVFGSDDDELTELTLVIAPGADGVTTSVIMALSLARISPKLQFTVLVPVQDPLLGLAETRVVPEGNASLTVTLVAVSGPLFVA